MRPFFALLALLWMGALWWLSDRPAPGAGLPHPWDKLAHFLAYALLGALWRRGLSRFALAFLLSALYGVVDEWHQSFVPGREAFGLDLVADFLGAYLGARGAGRWEAQEASRP
ncbi:VanZ family protein [Thermus sp.]|uniref:VanZ family protein n=1 Tax=Thermus sp. TaxID=275 RepID=UPI003D0C4A03